MTHPFMYILYTTQHKNNFNANSTAYQFKVRSFSSLDFPTFHQTASPEEDTQGRIAHLITVALNYSARVHEQEHHLTYVYSLDGKHLQSTKKGKRCRPAVNCYAPSLSSGRTSVIHMQAALGCYAHLRHEAPNGSQHRPTSMEQLCFMVPVSTHNRARA